VARALRRRPRGRCAGSAPAPPRRIAALAREHLAGCEYAAVVHKPFAIEEVLGIVARLLTA
jgi:hypothetical protein